MGYLFQSKNDVEAFIFLLVFFLGFAITRWLVRRNNKDFSLFWSFMLWPLIIMIFLPLEILKKIQKFQDKITGKQ